MGIYTTARDYFRNLYNLRKFKNKYKVSLKTVEDLSIKFNNNKQPLTTIVIPFNNQVYYTRKCLESIYINQPNNSFEIILVNDNSSENIDSLCIEGIKLINNDSNLGLVKSINKAIKEANGKYVYVLKNAAVVHKGFLDELHYVFNNFENVGAVGSMLLTPKGILKEAGCFVLKNGLPTKIANEPTFSPEINYIYQVDYCSSNSLLFERQQSNGELNLMDEHFSASTYVDADLCFQFKHYQNKNNYFSPFSKITLLDEDITKIDSNVSQIMLDENGNYFSLKWNFELKKINSDTKWNRIQELRNNKNIIFHHFIIPQPDTNSGDLRLTEIIKTYVKIGYHCAIIVPSNKIKNPYNQRLQRLGVRVYYEYKPFRNYYHFIEKLYKTKNQMWFSTSDIFLDYYNITNKYFTDSTLIFDMVDIHHLRFQRALEFDPNNKDYQYNYKKYLAYEAECAKKADITINISEIEKTYMTQFTEVSKLLVISNIHYLKVNLESIEKFNDRKDLLFIGSIHHPNIDAVNFLIDEILPHVWKKNPDIKLNIVGDVNKFFKNNQDSRINFLGFVPDISELFLKSRMMVAPLRYGAGVKGKIGQAFEYYLPLVTSTIGAEGMFLEHEKNSLLADDAESFSEQILRLYNDEKLWGKIQNNLEQSLAPFSIEHLTENINKIANFKNNSIEKNYRQ